MILRDEYIKALPTLFLSRQFGDANNFLAKIYNSENLEDAIIQSHWHYLARLNSLVSLGKQGVTTAEELVERYEEQYEKEFKSQRVNLVITFPGIPKRQKTLGMNAGVLSDKEQRIIRIIGAHRAIARNGILTELPIASETLFQEYDRLEECCKNGTNNKFVLRMVELYSKKVCEISKEANEDELAGSLSYLNTKEKEFLAYLLKNRIYECRNIAHDIIRL